MARCPACGETLPASAVSEELCQTCLIALDTGVDTSLPLDQEKPAPEQTKPKTPITYVLIALNVVVFVAMRVATKSWSELTNDQLLRWGADWGPVSLHYQWWRMLTSNFAHQHVSHLLDNLLILWILGIRAERIFGKRFFLLLYLSCGVAGSITQLAMTPERVITGASGAIFGLFGALTSAFFLGRVVLSTRAKWGLGLVSASMIYSLYGGATDPRIGNSAHTAGLVFGLVFGALALSRLAATTQFRRRLLLGTVAVLLAGAASVQLADGYLAPLDSASRAMQEGRVDEAIAATNIVLQKNPNSLLANTFVADCYYQKREYMKAELAAKRAVATDPDDRYAAQLLGKILRCAGRSEEAIKVAGQMLVNKRTIEQAGLILAEATQGGIEVIQADMLLSDQPDAAIALYNKALDDCPNNYKAQLGLVKAYRKKGMQKEATSAAAKAAQMEAEGPKN